MGPQLIAISAVPVSVNVSGLPLSPDDVAAAVSTAMLGQRASSVLEGDRVVTIRVRVDSASIGQVASLRELPVVRI